MVTIARVDRDSSGRPVCRLVEHQWWTGRDHVWQYDRLRELHAQWQFSRLAIDSSGIGHGLAAFLEQKLGERVEAFVFCGPSKSQLAYDGLAMINTARLKTYDDDDSPESGELWREIRQTRYQLRTNEQMSWGVPETEGHDDFVTSLLLCARAAEQAAPPPWGGLVRAPAFEDPDLW